jgi:hypothetical protein
VLRPAAGKRQDDRLRATQIGTLGGCATVRFAGGEFPVIPVEPGVFSIFPITAVLVAKTARKIKPLPDNSRNGLNGNLFGPKRELNTPNRELH